MHVKQGSNRTFMELKYTNISYHFTCLTCSNRTFMELKLRVSNEVLGTCKSSNRTFMELKFAFPDCVVFETEVLIVPLWN